MENPTVAYIEGLSHANMSMLSPEAFGLYLKRKRTELDLSQEEVAERGGFSQSHVSELEKSAKTDRPITPKPDMVEKIAKGLGVPIEDVEMAVVRSRVKSAGAITNLASRSAHSLSTGDIVFLSPDDPDPERTITALDAWLQGWRARQ